MTSISAGAVSAREAARRGNGWFGAQGRAEAVLGASGVDLVSAGPPPNRAADAIARARRVLESAREHIADWVTPPKEQASDWASRVRDQSTLRALEEAGWDVEDLPWLQDVSLSTYGRDLNKTLASAVAYARWVREHSDDPVVVIGAARAQAEIAANLPEAVSGSEEHRKRIQASMRAAARLNKATWNGYKDEAARAAIERYHEDLDRGDVRALAAESQMKGTLLGDGLSAFRGWTATGTPILAAYIAVGEGASRIASSTDAPSFGDMQEPIQGVAAVASYLIATHHVLPRLHARLDSKYRRDTWRQRGAEAISADRARRIRISKRRSNAKMAQSAYDAKNAAAYTAASVVWSAQMATRSVRSLTATFIRPEAGPST